jgi:hypothetical protein
VRRLAAPHHGTVRAVGFVLDHGLVGEDEARRRVLQRWAPGTTLRTLDEHRWVLLLAEPEEVHCHAAPGLPLTGDAVSHGSLELLDQGHRDSVDLAALPSVDPGTWLSTDHLQLTSLVPCQAPPPAATAVEYLAPARNVDLRDKAAVRARSAKAEATMREVAEASRKKGRSGVAGGAQQGRPPRDRLVRLVMRTPIAGQISRRHAKYLEDLTRSFERRDYASALRDAIGLGGNTSYLSLRLPSPRSRTSGVTPTLQRGGGGMPLGLTAQQHLSQLYRQAAADLEKQGRIAEAAFVFADLMKSVGEAVALLERHGELGLAAELAEGRNLDPAEVVRLWWRAGQRERAIGIARSRGAHAAAIERLEKVDRESAVSLREHWAQSLARAGDYLGAVEISWKAEELRSRVHEYIATGMALGGTTAARLFAYQLALHASGEAVETAVRMLQSENVDLLDARDSFLSTFAELPAADAAADRRLATLALRLLAGSRAPLHWSSAQRRTAHNALRERADPVLREDLPSGFTPGKEQAKPSHALVLGGPEGQVDISDAVPLAGGTTLIACGSHGLRLISRTGALRGHWDVPTHQVIAAYHGGSAVIASDLGRGNWELHRFDLVTQRLDRWVVIRAAHLVTEFDGTVFNFVDETGTLIFLDVEADRARVVWTEVNEGEALEVRSSASSMAALVRFSDDGQFRYEAWRWDLPQRALRQRQRLDITDVTTGSVLPDGKFVALLKEGEATRLSLGGVSHVAPEADGLRVSGSSFAVLRQGKIELTAPNFSVSVSTELGDGIRFRENANRITVWDDLGHLAILDGMTGQTVLHTQLRV